MYINQEIIVDSITPQCCLSVRKKIGSEYWRCAFCPGQWDELEEWIPNYKIQYPEIAEQISEIWVPEVISTWRQKQADEQELLKNM